MSAYPVASFGSEWHSAPAPSRSPSSHVEDFGNTTLNSNYPKTQSLVTEALPSQLASTSCPRLVWPSCPTWSGDGDPPALMTDPDRFTNLKSELHSQPQQSVMMEGLPMAKTFLPSTEASPASQSKSGGVPADAGTPSEEEEELALTASEVEENATDVGIPRSTMERATERRKLKRFRLVS